MLFFSKEEFVEEPLKDILDSFQVTTTDTPFEFPDFLFTLSLHPAAILVCYECFPKSCHPV